MINQLFFHGNLGKMLIFTKGGLKVEIPYCPVPAPPSPVEIVYTGCISLYDNNTYNIYIYIFIVMIVMIIIKAYEYDNDIGNSCYFANPNHSPS